MHANRHNQTQLRPLLSLLLCLLAFLTIFSAPAQNDPPPTATSRFLFIVDTSAAMQSHAPEILKVVSDLLVSGAGGQLHPGDTIGLWTFDQDVHSDLPLQSWSVGEQTGIAQRTTEFLKQQLTDKTPRLSPPPATRGAQVIKATPVANHKPSNLGTILPDLFTVIQASDTITVFIISTGDGQIKGTPFDAEINALYLQSVKDMQGHRLPIVTVLQARSGKILHYTLNALPWPVVLPQPLVALEVKKPTPVAPPKPAPITTTPTLAQPQPTPVVAAPTPVPPAPIVTTPAPITPPVEVPKPTPVIHPETTSANPITVPHDQPAPIITGNPVLEATVPTPHNTQPPVIIQNPEPHGVPPSGGPPTPRPAPISTEPSPAKAPAPAPLIPEPIKPVVSTAPAPIAQTRPAISAPTTPSPPTATPAELASASPEPPLRSTTLLIAGMVLVVVALILIALIYRRSRATAGPSLITRSMGNRRK